MKWVLVFLGGMALLAGMFIMAGITSAIWGGFVMLAILIIHIVTRLKVGWKEEDVLPPTIDGRSEATGMVRYKFEDGEEPPAPPTQ